MPRFRSDSLDQQQRLNLSPEAFAVMENDMFVFGVDRYATFLNRVFANYCGDAAASIAVRCEQERDRLTRVLAARQDGEALTALLLRDYQAALTEKARSYPKGRPITFRINNENFRYLTEDDVYHEERYYTRMGRYFKAVIEEYAGQPYRQRERVYFLGTFRAIEAAIDQERQLSVLLPSGASHSIAPYAVVTDPLSMYHYLVGKDCTPPGTESDAPRYFSYRVTNLTRLRVLKSKSGHLTKQERRQLEEELAVRGAQFMSGGVERICVRLTPDGVKKYRRLLHLRPAYTEIQDGSLYVFACTPAQAEFYFFKFGPDAQVISPASLAETFKERYAAAARLYGA